MVWVFLGIGEPFRWSVSFFHFNSPHCEKRPYDCFRVKGKAGLRLVVPEINKLGAREGYTGLELGASPKLLQPAAVPFKRRTERRLLKEQCLNMLQKRGLLFCWWSFCFPFKPGNKWDRDLRRPPVERNADCPEKRRQEVCEGKVSGGALLCFLFLLTPPSKINQS